MVARDASAFASSPGNDANLKLCRVSGTGRAHESKFARGFRCRYAAQKPHTSLFRGVLAKSARTPRYRLFAATRRSRNDAGDVRRANKPAKTSSDGIEVAVPSSNWWYRRTASRNHRRSTSSGGVSSAISSSVSSINVTLPEPWRERRHHISLGHHRTPCRAIHPHVR